MEELIQKELEYIEDFPFEEYNRSHFVSLVSQWKNTVGLEPNVEFDSSLDESILRNLTQEEKTSLKNLRLGLIGSNILNNKGLGRSLEDTIANRMEYGGYIDRENISLEFQGDAGVITDFEFRVNKINFHTHPYQVDTWCYAPPSEDDLYSTITESIKLGRRVVSLVAAAEGIYIYYASNELLEKFREGERDSIETYSLLRELKNLLGYVSNDFGAISRTLFGGSKKSGMNAAEESDNEADENDGAAAQFHTPPPKKQRLYSKTYHSRKLSIEQYLELMREMGFYMNLYNYDDETIQLPIDNQRGGTKKYKIKFTVL